MEIIFMNTVNIGLNKEQRQNVVNLLNQDLADIYLLIIKTKKYHWDVVGSHFRTLHMLWEEQYDSLSMNLDAIAERVRLLSGYPIGTAKGFLDNATLREHPGDLPDANEMINRLVGNHEQVIRNLRDHVDQCGKNYHDEGTADFLTGLMQQHEEMAWMLRSFIEGNSLVPSGHRESNLKTPATV